MGGNLFTIELGEAPAAGSIPPPVAAAKKFLEPTVKESTTPKKEIPVSKTEQKPTKESAPPLQSEMKKEKKLAADTVAAPTMPFTRVERRVILFFYFLLIKKFVK